MEHELVADDMFMNNDDASSQASMNSFKYSTFQFCDPGHEDEHDGTERHKWTTLSYRGGGEEGEPANPVLNPPRMECSCGCRLGSGLGCPRLTRIRSCPHERRSQQLQRSMMLEEIYKYNRRFLNTVGTVENIGFRHPLRGGVCFPRV